MFDTATDQATGLREMFEQPPGIAVLSMASVRRGMGFVSMVTNIAACYARIGQRVIVIDAGTPGAANALGLRMQHDLASLLSGEREFADVAVKAPEGPYVLKAQKGVPEYVQIAGDPNELFLSFRRLEEPFDVAILAGQVGHVAALTRNEDELVFVTNADGEALTATYSAIKRAQADHEQNAFRVLVNRVDHENEAVAAFKRLADTARKFLGVSIEYAGSISRDAAFAAADRGQCSVYGVAATGNAARQISKLVQSMPAWRLGRYALNEN